MRNMIFLTTLLTIGTIICVVAQSPSLRYTEIKGPFGKPFGRIRNITQDTHGYMWFSDEKDQRVYRYDGKTYIEFKHDENNPNSLAPGKVRSVYGDPKGPIWIAVGNGLDRFDPATGKFTHYVPDPNDPASLADGAGEIVRDRKGRLWVGTGKSVDLLDESTGTFKHFGNDESDPYSIYHVGVWNLYEDRQGTIWAACGIPWADAGERPPARTRATAACGTPRKWGFSPHQPSGWGRATAQAAVAHGSHCQQQHSQAQRGQRWWHVPVVRGQGRGAVQVDGAGAGSLRTRVCMQRTHTVDGPLSTLYTV